MLFGHRRCRSLRIRAGTVDLERHDRVGVRHAHAGFVDDPELICFVSRPSANAAETSATSAMARAAPAVRSAKSATALPPVVATAFSAPGAYGTVQLKTPAAVSADASCPASGR